MFPARLRACLAHPERGSVATGVAIAAGGLAVAASLVAVSVTGAGFAGSQRIGQAADAALRQTTSGAQVQGPPVARTDGAHLTSLQLDIALRPGSPSVSLSHGARGALRVRYLSDAGVAGDVPYSAAASSGLSSPVLADGEVATITLDLAGLATPPAAGDHFRVELQVADGVAYAVEETMPAGRPLPPVALLP